MCGSALGAPHQNDRAYQVVRRRPDGPTDFYRYDMSRQPVEYGHYTGDFSLLLAVARSLAQQRGAVDARELLAALVGSYSPDQRRYSTYDGLVLEALMAGSRPAEVPALAEQFLAATTQRYAGTTSDRPEREPHGPADYCAAARAAPIGLLYRSAPPAVLLQAVRASCEFSHPTPLGLDAAHVVAASVAWLARQEPGGVDCKPAGLLQGLITDVAYTADMAGKLRFIREHLFQVGEVADWRQFYRGPAWARLLSVFNSLCFHGFATAGSEAAAVALWVLLVNWNRPEQAVIMAASLGGNSSATAQIVGAMAGALYGDAWVPPRWRDALENGPETGRDAVLQLGAELEALYRGNAEGEGGGVEPQTV